MRPTKALIPCGGRGTRMRALAGALPKELLPVAGTPALEWVARECASSGIEELLVITAPGKDAIAAALAPLARRPGLPQWITCREQAAPRGLADAIRLGRDFAGDAPLAVALPDNLFMGNQPALDEVIETFTRRACSTVAIAQIDAREAARRGPTAIYDGHLEGDDFLITRIPDKGAPGATFDAHRIPVARTGVGRYVFTPEVFAEIDAVERTLGAGVELDDVPVMQRLLARGRLVGRRLHARFLDLGLPAGYAEANTIFAS